jgi:hypothetical protein
MALASYSFTAIASFQPYLSGYQVIRLSDSKLIVFQSCN